MLKLTKGHIASLIVVASLAGGGAVAYASASPSRPSETVSAAASTVAAPAGLRQGKLAKIIGRAVHGQIVVRTKSGFETVTFDRGKVTNATSTSITLLRPDQVSVTLTLGSATRYLGITGASDIKSGQGAVVISRDGSATAVAQRAKPRAKARASTPAPATTPSTTGA